MSEHLLSGPYIAPASGKAAKQFVVFLHGLGADGNDLIGLAPHFAEHLPDAEFFSPDAPFAFDMAPYGRQWFTLRDMSPETVLAGVRKSAVFLDGFLDQELAGRGLTERNLALIGFSQGTMMSLHVSLRRKLPCAAVVGFSGRLVAPELLDAEIKSRPSVLLVHGDADPVVPYSSLALAETALRAHKVPVETLTRPGLGHGIDGEGLEAAITFLARHFAG